MTSAQPAIFVEGTRYARFIGLNRTGDDDALHTAAQRLSHAAATGAVNVVVGFGPSLANALQLDTPESFGPLPEIGTSERSPVIDQHDVIVWLHGDSVSDVFDTGAALIASVADHFGVVSDFNGFIYHDERDLTGFIDGTENPDAEEAKKLAVVTAGSAAGTSVLLAQRWIHNLAGFGQLPQSEQEAVFGRTKPDSVELDPLPESSHVGCVVIEDDAGEEIEIYRRSFPYSNAGEHGLYFIGFSDDQTKLLNMLHAMFDTSGTGVYDRLTDFSEAVATGIYVVPAAAEQ